MDTCAADRARASPAPAQQPTRTRGEAGIDRLSPGSGATVRSGRDLLADALALLFSDGASCRYAISAKRPRSTGGPAPAICGARAALAVAIDLPCDVVRVEVHGHTRRDVMHLRWRSEARRRRSR